MNTTGRILSGESKVGGGGKNLGKNPIDGVIHGPKKIMHVKKIRGWLLIDEQ